eukprot:COSAG06_NODE_4057_length_4617_cov_7.820496_7_plen_51_part_00
MMKRAGGWGLCLSAGDDDTTVGVVGRGFSRVLTSTTKKSLVVCATMAISI